MGEAPAPEYDQTLSIFFEGTANRIRAWVTQIAEYADGTEALDISDLREPLPEGSQYKMLFDGCGAAFGFSGTIWGTGLEDQCKEVLTRVQQLLERGTLRINALGLSRGGVAVILLAQMLPQDVPVSGLQLNALLFDPVPGNLVSTAWMSPDPLARRCKDISTCQQLCNVLALYPCEPLPALAFHAPVLTTYPKTAHCHAREEVLLGCHQGALLSPQRDLSCRAACLRIQEWLLEVGSPYRPSSSQFQARGVLTPEAVLNEYDSELRKMVKGPARSCHSLDGKAEIVKDPEGAQFVNHHHWHLAKKTGREVPTPPGLFAIRITGRSDLFSGSTREFL
mmetsp:Transcript_51978/g.113990  ORF Transcript_51978/g.113990 Transcript_51978/m.113990 type:complete len:337 (+) Transcript_51978:19-1029(+)